MDLAPKRSQGSHSLHRRLSCAWLPYLQQGLAVAAIEVYLSGLCYFNLLAKLSEVSLSFHSPNLKLLLRGIQQANVSKKPSLVHFPITMGILAKIVIPGG